MTRREQVPSGGFALRKAIVGIAVFALLGPPTSLPGTYTYFCALHPRMTATVIVK